MNQEFVMLTIKDIAREAGVSVTTVSNVIHGNKNRVAKETVDRINKIIKQYNYTPNMSARSLVNKSSRIIGVINHLIPKENGSFIQDPFHGAFIGGIERRLRDRGYFLMLRTVEDGAELFSLFRNWNLDGIIATGLFKDDFYDLLLKTAAPMVLIDSYVDVENEKVFNVGLEDYTGGYIATKFLIENGHRSIVFASPKRQENGVIAERYKGYCAALTEACIPVDPRNCYEQEITINEGKRLGRALSHRKDITAVFATADILAAGLMSGLREVGVSVPEDISVVGFDDLSISRIITPQLTTVHQDADAKGALAGDILVDYLEGRPMDSRNVIMPVRLVVRDSVRRI